MLYKYFILGLSICSESKNSSEGEKGDFESNDFLVVDSAILVFISNFYYRFFSKREFN